MRGIDFLIRRRLGVFEFDPDPRNILRAQISRSLGDRTLADGTQVHEGDPLVEFHFWNEHLPRFAPGGGDVGWGVTFLRLFLGSLTRLASYLESPDNCSGCSAVHAEFGLWERGRELEAERFFARLGFEVVPGSVPGRNMLRGEFWKNLYSWWLVDAFNPGSQQAKSFRLVRRYELWISRERLLSCYGRRKP